VRSPSSMIFPICCGNESISKELVVAVRTVHPRAEELRALRTQLLMRWSKAGVRHRALAIVSPAVRRRAQLFGRQPCR